MNNNYGLSLSGVPMAFGGQACLVLERIVTKADLVPNTYFTEILLDYPISAGYIFFSSDPSGKLSPFATTSNEMAYAAFSAINGERGGRAVGFFNLSDGYIYVYRKVQKADSVDGYGIEIYNERGSLAFTSAKPILQINQIIDLYPFANQVGGVYVGTEYMVLSMPCGYSPGDFWNVTLAHGVVQGKVFIGTSMMFAGTAQKTRSIYSWSAVVAKRPDIKLNR